LFQISFSNETQRMINLTLEFSPYEPSLSKVAFSHPINDKELLTIRGRTSGANLDIGGTFPWTKALTALSVLGVSSALQANAVISGLRGSPASSLDYAITKGPVWIHEMFGTDRNGTPRARNYFRRTNTELKRVGPVLICFSPTIEKIQITRDGNLIEDEKSLKLLLEQLNQSKREMLPICESEAGPESVRF
jgi:hypothetical protein